MNVKQLKELLSELPEECDELPVFAYTDHAQHYESVYSPTVVWIADHTQHYESVYSPTVVWISDDYDYSVDSKEESERMAALAANSTQSIAYMQAQANLKIAEGIANGKVNTIVVPMEFKGMVNIK